MSLPLLHAVLLVLPMFIFCADRDRPCVTPNGENATCIPVVSCDVILQAILTGNDSAIEFGKSSQCGYDTQPLICCGSSAFSIVGTTIPKTSLLPGSDVCGIQLSIEKIHGGMSTDLGEFPWMVLLGYTSSFTDEVSFKCGGTLINSRYVLTAAHCVKVSPDSGLALDMVRLGEWNISTSNDCIEDSHNIVCSDPVVDMKIEKQIPHPSYSKRSSDNDIALLRLESNVKFTEFIQPICLPPFNAQVPKVGTRLIVSGWGNTENGTPSNSKLKLEVPVYSTIDCMAKLNNRRKITDNQLCAGGEQGKDSCQGDSGGPLMGMRENTTIGKIQWYQEGVVAWGVGCGNPGFPGIYTRVSTHMGWMLDNMSEF